MSVNTGEATSPKSTALGLLKTTSVVRSVIHPPPAGADPRGVATSVCSSRARSGVAIRERTAAISMRRMPSLSPGPALAPRLQHDDRPQRLGVIRAAGAVLGQQRGDGALVHEAIAAQSRRIEKAIDFAA